LITDAVLCQFMWDGEMSALVPDRKPNEMDILGRVPIYVGWGNMWDGEMSALVPDRKPNEMDILGR
jgi:hypothetical protein